MDLDNLIKDTSVRERKSKPSKPKGSRKSARIGAFFTRTKGDTTSKKGTGSYTHSESPLGSKSPREGTPLRDAPKSKRLRGSKSVNLQPVNLSPVVPSKDSRKKLLVEVPPSPSPGRPKDEFIPENDPIYKLRQSQNELAACEAKIRVTRPFEKRIESLVHFVEEQRDPLTKQHCPSVNPYVYVKEQSCKINEITKRHNKLLDQEKKKLPPKDGYHLGCLICGASQGQSIFWQGVDTLMNPDDMRNRYQKPFIYVLTDYMLEGLRAVKIFQIYDEISASGQLVAHEFLDLALHVRTTPDFGSLPKFLVTLWKENVIANAVRQSLTFHPQRESILYLFENIENITSPSYTPNHNIEYPKLLEISPPGTYELKIKLSNLIFYFTGTDRIRGSQKKWICQFPENDIILFMANISTAPLLREYQEEFRIIVNSMEIHLCYFVFLLGSEELANGNHTSKDLERLPSYNAAIHSNMRNYAEESFKNIILKAKPQTKESHIFIEHMVSTFSIDSLLENCKKVARTEESERLMDLAQFG